jgi:hypothetical protein
MVFIAAGMLFGGSESSVSPSSIVNQPDDTALTIERFLVTDLRRGYGKYGPKYPPLTKYGS